MRKESRSGVARKRGSGVLIFLTGRKGKKGGRVEVKTEGYGNGGGGRQCFLYVFLGREGKGERLIRLFLFLVISKP